MFKVKYDEVEKIKKFKARLVVQGFSQVYGIDYEETFAPTVCKELLRIFLALVTAYDLELYQMDVVAAYLSGELNDEKIYIRVPQGVTVRENPDGFKMICRFRRGLYGLKQLGRVWNKKLVGVLKRKGYSQINGNPSILVRKGILIGVYVDDLLIAAKTLQKMQKIKNIFNKAFKIKDLGKAKIIIGIRVIRDRLKRILTLDQASYVHQVLEKERIRNYFISDVFIKPKSYIKLAVAEDTEDADLKIYQRILKKLNYLTCNTRPDIAFAVGILS